MADLARGPHELRELEDVRVRTRIERRRFGCRNCGAAWVATYEIRDYLGRSGVRWVVHCQDGRPVPGPQFGDRCPSCGRVSVSDDDELGPAPKDRA